MSNGVFSSIAGRQISLPNDKRHTYTPVLRSHDLISTVGTGRHLYSAHLFADLRVEEVEEVIEKLLNL